jgi:UPF0755 protein
LIKRALWLLLLIAFSAGAWLAYFLATPVALPVTPFEFDVKSGVTMKRVAQQLAQAGVLKQPLAFTLAARLTGKGSALKAGNYALNGPVTPWELLQKLTKGDVNQIEVKFIEGWNFKQLRQALDNTPNLQHDTRGMSDTEIMAKLGWPDQHPEGRFFPDTYFFSSGMSDLAILSRAHKLMQNQLENVWRERAANLPYDSMDQALIMASIIEKETGQAAERPMIAGVFINRLRIGMLLQTDPTVIYGLGDRYDGNLHKRDLQADTPYNTYTRAGLPPTPIAMPGIEALRAAVNPAPTRALYFVARGNGAHKFSATLAEHNQAVNKYQRQQ